MSDVHSFEYSYDVAGNVTSMVRDGVVFALTWTSQHQLVSAFTHRFS